MQSQDASRDARPTGLRVEGEADPRNVDPERDPRFSWRLDTDDRDAGQAAYRVAVGRDRDAVANGDGDTWESGWVDARRATGVAYGGPPLASDTTYVWSVQLRTRRGAETEWAAPATFTTARREREWRGEWVTHQPGVGDTDGWRGRWRADGWDGAEWVQVDFGESREIRSVALHPAAPVTTLRTPDGRAITEDWTDSPIRGFGFPDAYRVEVADDPAFADATVVADVPDADTGESHGRRTVRRATPARHDAAASGRYVRVTATDLHTLEPDGHPFGAEERKRERAGTWHCFALAALTVEGADGVDHAAGQSVTASSSVETATWGREHLVNGVTESTRASDSPHLRTEFDVDGKVASARLHVAAVGYGEAYVNGETVDEGRLNPGWTDYEERVLYTTSDVTDALEEGTNALGLWLGRGWFAKTAAHWTSAGSPRARAHLTVRYADGTTQTLATSGNWEATESPITENDVYNGERYDARLAQPDWANPGADTDDWASAEPVSAPGGVLKPQHVEPMDVVETIDVQDVHDHPEGPILDFGQNLTGWLDVTVRGTEAGDEVVLRHAEALTEDGDLSTTDLRSADATDTYVARGDDIEEYAPRFTYHGFRYAQVSGYPGDLDPDDVTAEVVHTAMDERGAFACSDADLSQVQHNAVWGLRSNTHSIPEDCPQRDERFGWTGDAQISTRALLYNFDARRFEEKWLRDHADAASEMGYVTDVIPDRAGGPADPTWSVTRVLIPWYLYRHDGDVGVLREHYEGMRDYLDYWHSVTEDGILPERYGKFGDWLAFENCDEEVDDRRGLPIELFTTAYHYQVSDTFRKIAGVLGNETDAEHVADRAAAVKEAFNDRFFDPETATYGPGTQSSYAVPLYMGLVPDEHREAVVEGLVEKVESDGRTLRTGFLGTRPLIHTLADHGHADLAVDIVRQPEKPGWVYMAREGATTMWERWDSDESVGSGMNSLNHSPYTHVSEFLYEVLGGLRVGDDPLTEHVTVAPTLANGLDWADASVETPTGEVSSGWVRAGDGYDLDVTVPWNATATVRLPDAADRTVEESGVGLSADGSEDTRADVPVEGVRDVRVDDGDLVLTVGSGDYALTVR
ncbi:family 78 glycoside hydrolase catalytic domain [Halarchaeum sp. P4]|uniref:family 78 glycoside hydrolase catalytic domain n=1 Tax=Halarchaeum sp. P4 TaxID=3421639 RepID=UPI003EBC4CD6